MSRRHDYILGLLRGEGAGVLDRYCDDPKPLLESLGVRLENEKSAEIFDAVYGDDPHVVVEAARGVGKTFTISKALACRFVFKNDDIFQLGGSEEQAKIGFAYVSELLYGTEQFVEFLDAELKTAATTKLGNWYKIAACSGTRVRGPHCGDPHKEMGNVIHGGVCYTDEEAEIPDDIVDAVRFTINTAKPRKRVRSSTAHKTRGRFLEVANNPRKFKARLIKADIIDVTEPCTYDCARCPLGHHFAGPLLGGKPQNDRAAKDLFPQTRFNGKPIPALPLVTPESAAAWEEWKTRNQFPTQERAMCEGRAKLHRPGHKTIESLIQDIGESQSRVSDEQELFCRRRQGGNTVLNGAALEACIGDYKFIEGAGEVTGTLDWGWNWTVFILWQEQNCLVVPFEVHYLKHMRIRGENGVAAFVAEKCKKYGCYKFFADSSHKHENAEIAADGWDVTPVPFAEWKDAGVRWLTGIIERRELGFPGRIVDADQGVGGDGKYEFPSPDHATLFTQMLGWHTGPDGKIVKQKDHGPDSTICLGAKFHGEFGPWVVECAGAGRRDFAEDLDR